MMIHIRVFPSAKDDKDCIEENMSYQSYAPDFDTAEHELGTLRKVTESDKKDEIKW